MGIQSMDGEMYSKARDAYMLYAQIEVDSASVSRAEFEDLREQAYLVSAFRGEGRGGEWSGMVWGGIHVLCE